MLFDSYDHFHLVLTDGQTDGWMDGWTQIGQIDARQTLVTVLITSVWTILNS